MSGIGCIVLAAGKGTRMKSNLPKVMHKVAGRSLLGHVISAAQGISASHFSVVVGPDMALVENEARAYSPECSTVVQSERKGTGDAVARSKEHFADFNGTVLVLYGDVPLISGDSLSRLVKTAKSAGGLAVLGFEAANPHGYGRLLRADDGSLCAIREQLDATTEEKAVQLCNSGIIAIDNELLWRLLPKIKNDNAKGEYYLTDIIGLAVSDNIKPAIDICPEDEVLGVNDRNQLAIIEGYLQHNLRKQAMNNGATLQDPSSVYFSADTVLGQDVVIEPNVVFGPGCEISDEVRIKAFSHLDGAKIAAGAQIGPYARLRPEAEIGEKARIGNFVEVKKSRIEAGAKVNHLTYIGDARIGAGANVGAGTITCNYDGYDKFFTDIGAGSFIGSNSSLVAPVKIGDGAYVGSGSVVTRNVPAASLAVSRPTQEVRRDWADKFRAKHEE